MLSNTFLPICVAIQQNGDFLRKIVVEMTCFPIAVSPQYSRKAECRVTTLGSEVCLNFRKGNPIPTTTKIEICWKPTISPNNRKGRCAINISYGKQLFLTLSPTSAAEQGNQGKPP